jgi:hypothetical protein
MGPVSAIPTVWNGVQYRSRLEARWAAFFSRIGWPALYEPIDLSGYIPDFIVGFDHAEMLVEVKPAMALSELGPHFGKIARSGWRGEALIVGASLFETQRWSGPILGMLAERDGAEWASPDRAETFRCASCNRISIHPSGGDWRCRSCGLNDAATRQALMTEELDDAWVEAGNEVQWRGVGATP